MEQLARDGSRKIVTRGTLPLTGCGVVNRIITDLAVPDVAPNWLVLGELAPGVTADEVLATTSALMHVDGFSA